MSGEGCPPDRRWKPCPAASQSDADDPPDQACVSPPQPALAIRRPPPSETNWRLCKGPRLLETAVGPLPPSIAPPSQPPEDGGRSFLQSGYAQLSGRRSDQSRDERWKSWRRAPRENGPPGRPSAWG